MYIQYSNRVHNINGIWIINHSRPANILSLREHIKDESITTYFFGIPVHLVFRRTYLPILYTISSGTHVLYYMTYVCEIKIEIPSIEKHSLVGHFTVEKIVLGIIFFIHWKTSTIFMSHCFKIDFPLCWTSLYRKRYLQLTNSFECIFIYWSWTKLLSIS